MRAEQSKYESIQRQRNSVVNRYKRAYQEFLDLESGLQSAKNWYSEMKETVRVLRRMLRHSLITGDRKEPNYSIRSSRKGQ